MTKSIEASKRKRIAETLRRWKIIPRFGEKLNEDQFQMMLKIKNNDFDFFEDIKLEISKTTNIYFKGYCCPCGEKDPEKYYKGTKSVCIKCGKEFYKNRPDKKEYIQRQLENYYNKEWDTEKILHVRLIAAKHRAIKKGIEFNLTDEFVKNQFNIQNGKCFISKVSLTFNPNDWTVASIDRLDSSKGYTEDNSVLVTRFINNSKSDMSYDEFLLRLKEIDI